MQLGRSVDFTLGGEGDSVKVLNREWPGQIFILERPARLQVGAVGLKDFNGGWREAWVIFHEC